MLLISLAQSVELFLDVISCLFMTLSLAVSTPALTLCFTWKLEKTLSLCTCFTRDYLRNTVTWLFQAGGLMSRLHANSYSSLDFFHNAETHYAMRLGRYNVI